MNKIKYLVMDVDGTLTNGKIYMGQEGEIAKAFDIKDGCGILLVLPKYDIVPVIITARKSIILERRCDELGITELHQGVKNKLTKLREIVGDNFSTVTYVGDDLPDIPCMMEVKKAGGLVMCPSDAITEIKAIADYVSGYKAGEGAIRDCINYLTQRRDNRIEDRIRNVIEAVISGNYYGGIIDGNPYVIQEYETKDEDECAIESHRSHIDIQYMIEGHEEFKTYLTNGLTSTGAYDVGKDAEYWQEGIVACRSILVPGSMIVVYNGQPHKGAIKLDNKERVKKLVCKIDVR